MDAEARQEQNQEVKELFRDLAEEKAAAEARQQPEKERYIYLSPTLRVTEEQMRENSDADYVEAYEEYLQEMEELRKENDIEQAEKAAQKVEKAAQKVEKAAREEPARRQFQDFLSAFDAGKFSFRLAGSSGQIHIRSPWPAEDAFDRLQDVQAHKKMVRLEPESGGRQYVTVSGLTDAALRALSAEGFAPAVVTETAEGQYQAVLKVSGDEQRVEKIQETLAARYGNGLIENIVVPGFHADPDSPRLPRVVKIDTAAPTPSAGRLLEIIEQHAEKYQAHEAQMRAHIAQQSAPQAQAQEQTPASPAGEIAQAFQSWKDQREQKAQNQGQNPQSDTPRDASDVLDALIGRLLHLIARAISAPLRAVGILPPAEVPAQVEQPQAAAPDFWQRQSPFTQQELQAAPRFGQAPAKQTQAQQETQSQTPTPQRQSMFKSRQKRGMSM